MNEEKEPKYCPNCSEDNTDIRGETDNNFYVMRCRDCDIDWLIKDVTGKVTIKVEVKE